MPKAQVRKTLPHMPPRKPAFQRERIDMNAFGRVKRVNKSRQDQEKEEYS
jgi:hypothetical protein